MRNSHICGATWRLMHCTMEPYFMVEFERALYNLEVIPRWKERFGGASATFD